MIRHLRGLAAALLLLALAPTAFLADSAPNHAVPIGRGATVQGFASAAAGAAGTVFVGKGASADPAFVPLSQDCVVTSAGVVTCTKTNNVPFAASATTDATSSANVNFLQGGTGAATESVQTKLRQSLSTADFGAVCDGATDDTAKIQAAGDAAIAQNKPLYIQESTAGCLVKQNGAHVYSLLFSAPIQIWGTPGRSILLPDGSMPTSVAVLYFNGQNTNSYSPTTVTGLFIGNPSSATRGGGHAIVFDTTGTSALFLRPRVAGNYIETPASGSGYSVYVTNSETNNPNGGFAYGEIANNLIGSGVSLNKAGDSISITGNVFYNASNTSSNPAIYSNLVNGAGGQAGNLVIARNNFGMKGGQIVLDCGVATNISFNEIEQPVTSTEANSSLVDLVGAACNLSGTSVSNNQIQSVTAAGSPTFVRIATATGTVVDGNVITAPTDFVPVVITAASTGTIIGSNNKFAGMTTQVTDGGTATLKGLKATYSLTSNALILGNGTGDPKVAAGLSTDGASKVTLGVAGTSVGSIDLKNATSGTITVQPPTGALGAVTVTIPAATDTLVGKATPDTLTNKTYDTAGTGNSFKINGTAISDKTGTGKAVLDTAPQISTIELGAPSDTTLSRTGAGDIAVEGNGIYRAGGTDVAVADGGTGLSAGTSGGTLYYSGSTTIASSAQLAANQIVVGGGTGAAPSTPGGWALSATALTATSSTSTTPTITIANTTADGGAASWTTIKNRSGGAASAGDTMGSFNFQAFDSGSVARTGVQIVASAPAIGSGNVSGQLSFWTANAGASTERFRIGPAGNVTSFGTIPTLSSCGTSPTIATGSTNTAGKITEGSTATGCTLTFANSGYSSYAFCVVSPAQLSAAYTAVNTNTTITITNTSATGNVYTYMCMGV